MEGIDQESLLNPPHPSIALCLQIEALRPGRPKHRIKDICETRVRYGYRRVHVLLQRDG
jgi:hypothetical protein